MMIVTENNLTKTAFVFWWHSKMRSKKNFIICV